MTALTSIWIASLIGAALFFVAGFFSGRRPAHAGLGEWGRSDDDAGPRAAPNGEDAAAAAGEGATLVDARDALRSERDALLAERAPLLRERAALTCERDTLARQRQALIRERDALVAERAPLFRERASLAAERDALRSERDALRGERDALRSERDALGSERDALGSERESLAQQVAELRVQLANAERVATAISELRGAADARSELLVQLEVQTRRLRELEHHRDENAFLRRAANESGALRRRIEELSSELASLRAQGLIQSELLRPALPLPTGDGRGTSEALQSLLDGIAAHPGMRAAVLADDLGLLIAGVGDHANPLAAFAGFLDGIAAKTREFLPMAPLRRVTVEDHNHATVSACPVVDGDARIALVTLTVGAAPSTEQMTSLVGAAAAALR
jgi:hypothetical protein